MKLPAGGGRCLACRSYHGYPSNSHCLPKLSFCKDIIEALYGVLGSGKIGVKRFGENGVKKTREQGAKGINLGSRE